MKDLHSLQIALYVARFTHEMAVREFERLVEEAGYPAETAKGQELLHQALTGDWTALDLRSSLAELEDAINDGNS